MIINKKILLFLICIFLFNISYSNENINFYFDNKYMSYKDKFINELAIKYNFQYKNFGTILIGRLFDKKGDYLNTVIYYDNGYNKIEVGNYNDISYYLQSGITNIDYFDNDYIFYIRNTNKNKLISRPILLSNQNLGYMDNNISNFNKTKYNPNINYVLNLDNLSFGLTFINKYNYYNNKKEHIYNIYKYGINYHNKINELYFDISFLTESNFSYNFDSQDIGLNFNYYGILLGGNYGFGKDLYNKKFEYCTYGVGYEISSLTMSLWYFESNYNPYNSINFNTNYNINKYLSVYFEFSNFKISNERNNSFNFGILIKN